MEYRCEVVTPAGRKRYLEILYKYLKSQKTDFDVWQLWINTENKEDIEYMKVLEKENDWIKCYYLPEDIRVESNYSICHFFEHTKREDTIYIRLDDDIVYLSPNFIKDFKKLRIEYPDETFIYPHIINNALTTFLHQKNKLFVYKHSAIYNCTGNAWSDPIFAEKVHSVFLQSVRENDLEKWRKCFHIWTLTDYERCSINSISWFGSVMKNKIISIRKDEEQDISQDLPSRYKIANTIFNGPICAHFAFYTQREHLESKTDILQSYKEIADNL